MDSQIPVIDFSAENLKPGTDKWFSASQAIRSALEADGYFYVTTNKVSMELYNSVFPLLKELFDLPLETKRQSTGDKFFIGYYERNPRTPLHESVGIIEPETKEAVQKFTDILWPAGYDHFCDTINNYAKLLVELEQTAKRLLFYAYGVDQRHCDSLIESTIYLHRSLKYFVPEKPEDRFGLFAHTDVSYFTILHQNNVTGLQVKLTSGEWIDTNPSPCMLLMQAGHALKVWSNDRIRPCYHQVIMREEKERFSTALFSFNRKMVQTQEELVDEDHPLKYEPYDQIEMLEQKYKQ